MSAATKLLMTKVCRSWPHVGLVVLSALLGCDRTGQRSADEPTDVEQAQATASPPGDSSFTFNRDVAPLVHACCAMCHRPGGSAPFALLTYQDVRRRADQVVEVTQSRFMPPWLPERGEDVFAACRKLSDAQIEMIADWVAAGAVEGDPADLPTPPQWPSGWQLGEPDLVVSMPRAFRLRADGPDVFRNFVLPVTTRRPRFVKAVEFRCDNPRVVHHAVIGVDARGLSRNLDNQHEQPGFDGMVDGRLTLGGSATDPGGQQLGWTPGKIPQPSPEGIAWRLVPGSDLVLQMHLQPAGKPESIRASIGLFFTDESPTRQQVPLLIGSREIDIRAGQADYVLTASYRLPVDVEVLGVYPHAHYLCRHMTAEAELPSGQTRRLIHIPQWDFNWQDEYRYATPIRLPAGTVVSMRYVYDNSAANIRNPIVPPRRVTWGEQSTDEMGDLLLQVVPAKSADLAELRRDYFRFQVRRTLSRYERRLAKHPEETATLVAAGDHHLLLGQHDTAVKYFRNACKLTPGNARWHAKLAEALDVSGRGDEAVLVFRSAAQMAPDDVEIQLALASVLARKGELKQAADFAQRVIERRPDVPQAQLLLADIQSDQGRLPDAEETLRAMLQQDPGQAPAHNRLANLYARQGQHLRAAKHYQAAVAADPSLLAPRMNLANLLFQSGKLEAAAEQYSEVVRQQPRHVDAHAKLGVLRAVQKHYAEALHSLRRAVEIAPGNAEALTNLGRVYEQQGRRADAMETYRQAVKLRPLPRTAALNLAWMLATSPDGSLDDGMEAVRLAQQAIGGDLESAAASALDTLAAAQAAAGRFDDAGRTAQMALRKARQQRAAKLTREIELRMRTYAAGEPYRVPMEGATASPNSPGSLKLRD